MIDTDEKREYNKILINLDIEKRKLRDLEYREKMKDIKKMKRKEYLEKTKSVRSEQQKKYTAENWDKRKKYMREYKKKRKSVDPLYKLRCNISTAIVECIKRSGNVKRSKTFEILGCTIDEFKIYLESKFESWMTWDNYGLYDGNFNTGWDIDHIIPNSNATTEDEVIKLNHYTNLQPLCSKVNRDIKKNNI